MVLFCFFVFADDLYIQLPEEKHTLALGPFLNMLDISALNAYIVGMAVDPAWHQEKFHRRRLFLEELGNKLVTPQVARRQCLPASCSKLRLPRLNPPHIQSTPPAPSPPPPAAYPPPVGAVWAVRALPHTQSCVLHQISTHECCVMLLFSLF